MNGIKKESFIKTIEQGEIPSPCSIVLSLQDSQSRSSIFLRGANPRCIGARVYEITVT